MSEFWEDVPGYEGLYQCNRAGQVKSLNRVIVQKNGRIRTFSEKVLSPVNHSRGYKQVVLCRDGVKQQYLVHRIIALTFLPNPNNLPAINHKNEDKTDNRAENLEWCTAAYNNAYGDRVQRVADKHRGLKFNEEIRRRMSEAHKNPSKETRKRLSLARKGKTASVEARRKISAYASTRPRGTDGRWS